MLGDVEFLVDVFKIVLVLLGEVRFVLIGRGFVYVGRNFFVEIMCVKILDVYGWLF